MGAGVTGAGVTAAEASISATAETVVREAINVVVNEEAKFWSYLPMFLFYGNMYFIGGLNNCLKESRRSSCHSKPKPRQ